MDRSVLPEAGFVDPSGANDVAVRDLTEEVLDRRLGELETADGRSPLPDRGTVPAVEIPKTPRSQADLLGDLESIVEGSMNPAHPGYIGHMDTIPTTISVLGDLVTSAINNDMLSV